MPSDPDATEKAYRLSALLVGHSDDVRSLASDVASRLFSTSRDGTARSWSQHGTREGTTGGWAQERVFEGYSTGFVNSVAWLGGLHASADGLDTGERPITNVFGASLPSVILGWGRVSKEGEGRRELTLKLQASSSPVVKTL